MPADLHAADRDPADKAPADKAPADRDPVGWYRLSLRSRMVLLTAAIVTAVVAAGGVMIVAAVEAELLEDAEDVAIVRADEVAELVATGSAPTRLPTTEVEAVVQVVSGGQLVAATSNVAEARAFDLPAQDPGTTQVMSVDVLPIDDTGPFRVVAHGMLAPEGPVTIFVAVPVWTTSSRRWQQLPE